MLILEYTCLYSLQGLFLGSMARVAGSDESLYILIDYFSAELLF